MANFYANYPGSGSAGSNASVGTNGAPIPTSATLVAGENPSLNLQPLQTDASGNLNVNVTAGTLTVLNPSVSPTGAAVPADATYVGVKSGANLVGLVLGQATMTASLPVTIASDQSAVPISAASLPLPAGAATSAKQPALGVAGTASTDVITVQGIAAMTPLLVNGSGSTQPISGTVTANQGTANATPWNENIAQINGVVPLMGNGITGTGSQRVTIASDNTAFSVNATLQTGANTIGAVTQASGPWTVNQTQVSGSAVTLGSKTSANSYPVVIASDQGAVQIKEGINVTGSGSAAAATVSTVATLTAPANTVGFILMSLDTSTANIRWAIGRTASTTLGQQLQPGRDSGFVPCGANVSICAESGTQNYDIQWISQ